MEENTVCVSQVKMCMWKRDAWDKELADNTKRTYRKN